MMSRVCMTSFSHNELSTSQSIWNNVCNSFTDLNKPKAVTIKTYFKIITYVIFLSIICVGDRCNQSIDHIFQLNFWPRLHISDRLVHDGSLDDGSVKDGSDHYILIEVRHEENHGPVSITVYQIDVSLDQAHIIPLNSHQPHQETILNQCWQTSMIPYGVTRPQWIFLV